jgi:hypothetical protein
VVPMLYTGTMHRCSPMGAPACSMWPCQKLSRRSSSKLPGSPRDVGPQHLRPAREWGVLSFPDEEGEEVSCIQVPSKVELKEDVNVTGSWELGVGLGGGGLLLPSGGSLATQQKRRRDWGIIGNLWMGSKQGWLPKGSG